MIEWRVKLIVMRLLDEKIDKIEKEINNCASLVKEKKVSNCFIYTCLS